MTNQITIDFETYSEINLKVAGAARYAQDPSTEVLCLSYSVNDGDPELWLPWDRPPKKLFKAVKKGYLVYAFNVFFEINIWQHICMARHGFPPVKFSQWRDTQAAAAMYAMPLSLDECGTVMGLDIVKDKRGKYLINKLCKPRKPSKANLDTRWTPSTAPQDFADLYEYCRQDVRAEMAIDEALPSKLTPRELEVWQMTLKQNLRGVPIDMELVDSVVEILKQHEEILIEELIELTAGYVTTGGQLARIQEFMLTYSVETEGMTKDHVDELLTRELPGKIRRLLEIRQLLSKSSTKKFIKLQECIGIDNRIYGCLKYHKATTGRWGGALLQPQNLPRASVPDVELTVDAFKTLSLEQLTILYSNIPETASMMVRPAICAPEGMELVDSDFSSIENCTVLWLAEDERGLKLLRDGLDLYIDMAVALHPEVTYDWIKEHKGISSHADRLRRHGKLTILGAVYSMGWKKFMMTCTSQGFDIQGDEAQKTISTFRNLYKPVVQLWYGLEKAAMRAVQTPNRKFTYKKLSFITEDNFLYMILPNGKRLAYYDPRLEMKTTPWGQKKLAVTHQGYLGASHKWGRPVLTPGRLTENASQATAREVLVDGMLNLESKGFKTILSVHDQALTLTKRGATTIEEYNEIMCTVSPMYDSLPLKASGYVGKRFRK